MQGKHWAIIFVVFLGIGFYLFLGIKPPSAPANRNTSSSVEGQTIGRPSTAESERILRLAKRIQTERDISLKRQPLSVVDGKAAVKFQVKVKKTCYAGDANAIKEDLRRDPSKKLFLTMESLDGGKEVYPTEISPKIFEGAPFDKTLNIPVSDKPKQYGVYLCTSSGGESCAGKPHIDINDVFMDQVNNPKASPPDRAYFFQYALIDADGMAVFSEHPAGDQEFSGLNKYLTEDRGVASNTANETVDRAKEWTHNLSNLPLTTGDGMAGLELPLAGTLEECLGKEEK